MKGRADGFALLSVLWLLAGLSMLLLTVGVPVTLARLAAENRIALVRAEWAARACLELYRARREAERSLPVDPVALGPSTSCALDSLRPDERVNPNATDSVGLVRLLRDEVQVASLLDWIDADDAPRSAGAEERWYRERGRVTPRNAAFADPAELALVRGLEDIGAETLEAVFTTRGMGVLSPNRAPRWALETITGLPAGLPAGLERARATRWFDNAEQTVAVVTEPPTIPEFRVMATRFSFAEGTDVVRARGVADIGRARVLRTLIATVSTTGTRSRFTRLVAR